jgi:hypothetical protein
LSWSVWFFLLPLPAFTAFGENDATLTEGKELELRNIKAWLQHARNIHTEMHHPKVTLRGAVAWITYYWTDSGSDQGKSFSSRGKSTKIFVKEKKPVALHSRPPYPGPLSGGRRL